MRDRHAARLAAVYAIISVAWILFSDTALFSIGVSPDLVSSYSLLKGLGFVALTTIGLYALVHRFLAEGAKREAMYRELFDANPNPMWFYDLETLAFLRVNDAAVRRYGYARGEFLRMTIADIRPSEDLDRLMDNIEVTRAGGPGAVDHAGLWRHRTKDGTLLWIDITSHVTEFEGHSAEVVLVRDVTEAHDARIALLRYQQDLERLVSERTEQLERANEELRAATEAKSAFLATMSHELRTPLNSIMGFSAILGDGMAGPLNDEQARQIGFLRDSAVHLHALIDDVLDLSRIESGREIAHVSEVALADVVASVDAGIGALASAKGLEWRTGPVPTRSIMTDARKVTQILLNVAGNAVKYTATGGVRLDVAIEDDRVRFEVHDTGPGIPIDERHRIFEEFVRIGPEPSAAEGSGLGLAIAARFARLLGGTLELTRSSREGSTFTLILPLGDEDVTGAGAPS